MLGTLMVVASVFAVAVFGLRHRGRHGPAQHFETEVVEEPRIVTPPVWRKWLTTATTQLDSFLRRRSLGTVAAAAFIAMTCILVAMTYRSIPIERRSNPIPTAPKTAAAARDTCRPMSVQETVESWDYLHDTQALRNVSDSSAVQTLFNQGLLWRWGFSLQGAHDAFSLAVQEDPTCAMCYWGLAYSVSPFPNIVALPDGTPYPHFSLAMNQDGRRYVEEAQRRPMRSEKESAYVDAMKIRFPVVENVERGHQEWREFLYGAKMLSIWKSDLGDLIAGSLAAEAFVNCIPWDYYYSDEELAAERNEPFDDGITWSKLIQWKFPTREASEFSSVTGLSTGERILDAFPLQSESLQNKMHDIRVKPLARVVEHLLLKMMEIDPFHPMALHIHIHLTEASDADGPMKGFQSALNLVKASRKWKAGHLIHMPSHNFLRVGEYRRGIDSNAEANKVDVEISERCMPPYVPEHNLNVLIASASMGGFFDVAEEYALELKQLPERITQRKYMSRGFDFVSLLNVLGHFGKWEKILAEKSPSEGARGSSPVGGFDYATAMYHFYRYMAQTHCPSLPRGRRMLAEDASLNVEFRAFREAAAKVPVTVRAIPGQGVGVAGAPQYEWAKIAMLYAEARNATLFGELARAIDSLREVQALATEMGYMEPPWTQQAPKQCLGYLLMRNSNYEEAENMYQQDLNENPHNPWSALGLSQLYSLMGRSKEAEEMKSIYAKSGSAELESSCPMLQID